MTTGWSLIAIAGGGVIVVGGGYLIYKNWNSGSQTLEPPPPPKKKKGIFDKAFSFLFGDKATEKIGGILGDVTDFFSSLIHGGSSFVDGVSTIPSTVQQLIKWVAIIGIVLIVNGYCFCLSNGDWLNS